MGKLLKLPGSWQRDRIVVRCWGGPGVCYLEIIPKFLQSRVDVGLEKCYIVIRNRVKVFDTTDWWNYLRNQSLCFLGVR